MEFISQYSGDNSDSEREDFSSGSVGSETDETPSELGKRQVRTVYLITYSQADVNAFPSRSHFANAICESFEECEGSSADVVQWVCSMEKHKKRRRGQSGFHFHMAVKLSKLKRWLPVRRYLEEHHGIQVNFSNKHGNYYSAWQYVTKEDTGAIFSEGHPDLTNGAPQTMAASEARSQRNTQATQGNEECPATQPEAESKKNTLRSRKRLSAFDVSEIAVVKGIKTRTGLLALANIQKKEGKTDLAEFIVNRGAKVVDEAIETGWEMNNAEEKLERLQKTRLELLAVARNGECADECDGRWLECAEDILSRNGITRESFQTAVLELLEKGRGKYRNLIITGPANCGKTFLLNPLTHVYKTFMNPATSNFAWVGAESAEVIFLNDFRWNKQVIAWNDFLLMLEGQLVHLPSPKSHFCKDIIFDKDTPIFCTSKHELVYIQSGGIDEKETEMMQVRWRVFSLHSQIKQSEQKSVPPCPRCFANFIMFGEHDNVDNYDDDYDE